MIVGIDLGTTNSLIAYWDEEGTHIISNVIGENSTPSVVSVGEEGEVYIGQIAKERLLTHPNETAAAFKRYMGTDKKFFLGEHHFTPEELSSLILKALKEDAEAFFHKEITEAVISVPAYFNDTQRKATKRAAELVGLKVERLISEPTAAAIAYGMNEGPKEMKYLIFDLGGGTFDVSILERFEDIVEVRALAGDNFLGGEDFKQCLIQYFLEVNHLKREDMDCKVQSQLDKQAEQCKIAISEKGTGKINLVIEGHPYELSVDEEKFEEIVAPILYRVRLPIERALRDAGLSTEEIDKVILVGGGSKMPVIKKMITKLFKKLPYTNINPDEAIARGAAIQGALKEKKAIWEEMILTDVCAYTLGTETSSRDEDKESYFLPIIERNTVIPVSRVKRLYPLYEEQLQINVKVYQGESLRVNENIKLGELPVKLPLEGSIEDKAIDVRYTYDINGILEVETTVVRTGEKKHLVIENTPGSMTDEELQQCLKKMKKLKIHPRDLTENKLLLAKGERLFEECLGEERLYIKSLIQEFQYILEMQDPLKIKKAAQELKKQLKLFDR